jgi:hypothetical protein
MELAGLEPDPTGRLAPAFLRDCDHQRPSGSRARVSRPWRKRHRVRGGRAPASRQRPGLRPDVEVRDAGRGRSRRTITMLNANTSDTFSLVALELAYQRDGDVELLTPQSHGMESSEARTRQRRRLHSWNEPQFLDALKAACPPEELEAATRLYRGLADVSAEVKFGTGSRPSASLSSMHRYRQRRSSRCTPSPKKARISPSTSISSRGASATSSSRSY